MAATDTFESFLSELPVSDRETLNEFIKTQREQMFAARSEEARVRIAHNFIAEAHDRLKKL
ncbi:MAG: hypothetical protein KF749_18330 [Bacteroidetes bacterium]|nr:hypothetical protein [Bacteroidota bacterium]MCW5896318.1 hypothetical protein [Bacteroidota bacterium]